MTTRRKTKALSVESLEDRRLLTVSVVDIDLDGDMDVLASSREGWFANVDGKFVRQESVPPTGVTYILADIDGNGVDDVVTHTSWIKFDDGEFLRHRYADAMPILRNLQAIDLGADGDLDIVARLDHRNGEIVVAENRGGTLLSPTPAVVPAVSDLIDMDPFDFDLDGDLDFLVRERLDDQYLVELSWYFNNGDGSYAKQTVDEYQTLFGLQSGRTNDVIDIDGDGDLDVFQRSESDHIGFSGASWLENVEADQLWPRHSIHFNSLYDFRDAPLWRMHDSDRDGDLDAVLWDGSQLENTGDEFKPCCKIQMVDLHLNSFEKGFGDINDDGVIDVISIRDQELFWYDGTVTSDEIQIQKVVESMGTSNSAANIDVAGGGTVEESDFRFLVEKVLEYPWGDSNFDHVCDTSDLVAAFRAGEYNDAVSRNSTWAEGDWNGDREFDSSDLVHVFQAGAYRQRHLIPRESIVGSSSSFEDISELFDDDLETRLYFSQENAGQKTRLQFDFDRAYEIQELRLRHGIGEALFNNVRASLIWHPIEVKYFDGVGTIIQEQTLTPDRSRHSYYGGYEYEVFVVDGVSDVVRVELSIEGCQPLVDCLVRSALHDVIFVGRLLDA